MTYPQRGRLDTLNARELYASPLPYGIPEVPSYEGPLPARFVSWSNRKRACMGDGLHMFCDDTRFEPVWTSVDRYARHFAGRVVCSADFSLYSDWPLAAAVWNTYRSRWLARAMAERGALVIPAVTWGSSATYDVAFLGVQRGATVAVSAYGARRFASAYRAGYEEMLRRLAPRRVLVVGGAMPEWMTDVTYYPAGTIADRRAA